MIAALARVTNQQLEQHKNIFFAAIEQLANRQEDKWTYAILEFAYLAELARRTHPVERVGVGPRLLVVLQAKRVERLAAHIAIDELQRHTTTKTD